MIQQKDPNEDGGGNPVPEPAPSDLAEHLTSVEHSLRSKYPNEDEGGDPVPKPAPSGLAERSTSVEISPEPRYPMTDDKSGRIVCFYDSQTVSDLFRADGGGNPVPKPAPSELAEHSMSVENSLRPLQAGPMEHPSDTPRRVVGVSDNQPVSEPRQSGNQKVSQCQNTTRRGEGFCKSASVRTRTIRQSDNQTISQCQNSVSEAGTVGDCATAKVAGKIFAGNRRSTSTATCCSTTSRLGVTTVGGPNTDGGGRRTRGNRVEAGEAIVVGVIGSAAPWFLTGWAHDVEIEFMIDTGCQVTILSTTVFQRMCTVNQAVRSALQPCRRQLVSADSSPLMVQGQLELDIVFPGLGCTMMFVVANIGSDG